MSYWATLDEYLIDIHEVKSIGPIVVEHGGGFSFSNYTFVHFAVNVGGQKIKISRYHKYDEKPTAEQLKAIEDKFRAEIEPMRNDLIHTVT